jgi:pimeloyl-ACP methyl ester carboxylesterase
VKHLILACCLLNVDGKVSLIGHSAGGWLARVYMEEFGASDISLLLTLGTPHLYGSSSDVLIVQFALSFFYLCSNTESNCTGIHQYMNL